MNPLTNQEEKSILLRGGPKDGEVIRLPKTEWNVIYDDHGVRIRYVRVARIEVWSTDDDTTIYLES